MGMGCGHRCYCGNCHDRLFTTCRMDNRAGYCSIVTVHNLTLVNVRARLRVGAKEPGERMRTKLTSVNQIAQLIESE
jgi:hypothetical protein